MLGGYDAVLSDIGRAYLGRSSNYQGTAATYLQMVFDRMTGYYPVHVWVGAVGLVLLGLRGYLRVLPGRLSAAVGALAAGEAFWYVLMREHTDVHPHTAYHVAFTMALGIAATAAAADALLRGRRAARIALVGAGLGLFGMAWSDAWTVSAGNLAVEQDHRWYRMQIEELSGRIPEDGIVMLGGPDPPLEYFLRRRTVVVRPELGELQWGGRRRFVLVPPKNRFEFWRHCLERFELVHRMEPAWGEWCHDLFDVDALPGERNAVAWRQRPRQAGARCSDKKRRRRRVCRSIGFRPRSRHADVAREMVEALAVRRQSPCPTRRTRFPGEAGLPA
jgi:hypothetical protein